jgi:hypothetical protein
MRIISGSIFWFVSASAKIAPPFHSANPVRVNGGFGLPDSKTLNRSR